MQELTTPIGAHVPASGGLAKRAVPYAERVEATAIQVFVGNPRGWAQAPGDPRQDEGFAAWVAERGVPAFAHAPMLVNLGSPKEETVALSVGALEHGLARAGAIGARGLVFHAGSAIAPDRADIALEQLRERLLPLLDSLEATGPDLLVEPTAGGGCPLVSRVEQLEAYLAAVDDHPKLGVCLDVCHAFAAGHDVATHEGMTSTLEALEAAAGPGRLRLVHANDSKDPLGSRRDRHASIGTGTIGLAGFAALFTHPVSAGVPMVVETPSGDDGELHAADITTLRELGATTRTARANHIAID